MFGPSPWSLWSPDYPVCRPAFQGSPVVLGWWESLTIDDEIPTWKSEVKIIITCKLVNAQLSKWVKKLLAPSIFLDFLAFQPKQMMQPVGAVVVFWYFVCMMLLLMAEILHQLIGSLSKYLQGLIHSRWCRISAINSSLILDCSALNLGH